MAPGADVGGAANRQIGDASVGLRTAVKGSQNKVGEKSGDSKGGSGEAPMLSARERLRLHVNRNLAMQQQEAKMGGASDKGPASAGGPSAPPRGASPGRLAGVCVCRCPRPEQRQTLCADCPQAGCSNQL
jgi:hypothetical protein